MRTWWEKQAFSLLSPQPGKAGKLLGIENAKDGGLLFFHYLVDPTMIFLNP